MVPPLTTHDELTGLPGAELFLEQAGELLRRAHRRDQGAGLILLELGFWHGSVAEGRRGKAERSLLRLTHRLRTSLREVDRAGRLADDELAVLLPGVDDAEGLRNVYSRIREPLVAESGDEQALAVTAGGVLFPGHGRDPAALVERARAGVRKAGEAEGGSELTIPPPSEAEAAGAEAVARPRLAPPSAGELRDAVERRNLSVAYQPVIRLSDGARAGAEALVRWIREDGSVYDGRHLVPVARQAGLLTSIDRRNVAVALETLSGWTNEEPLEWIAVNLALDTLDDPELPEEMDRLLRESGVEPRRLVVEISAREAQADPGRLRAAADRIRELGVRVALDDVGAGPVPFAPLREGGLDFLKIDPVLVRGVHVGPDRGRLVDGLAELGHVLGAEIVAEGVESEEERRRLADGPCDYVQGFHLGEPIPAAELR